MKRNRFMEFLNSKGQYAAIFAFIVVAGICAGTAAYNKSSKTDDSNVAKTPISGTSEPVLTNKNAKTEEKTDTPSKVQETQAGTKDNTEEKPAAEDKAQKTISDDEDEEVDIALSWPVNGDVILGYSPNSVVYDPTLDQYRTNDSVYISSSEGTDVLAAADGVVSEVVEDETKGNYVVIEHENGWKTTYGQLADITVSEGSAVSKGDVLGVVAAPSVYSSAMGPHVEFMVTLDDVTVDPEVALG